MLRVALTLLLFATVSAKAAGYQQIMAPDPGHDPIEIGLWYPSPAPASDQPIELSTQSVAPNGAMSPGAHPMIVISHGQAGSLAGHYDTALALADAGYVVVAPTHTGDNWHDQSGVLNIIDRPRQIIQVIDFMLTGWPGHASIDPQRIGMFGFSAGGFTTLVNIGGRPDLSKTGPYCATHAAEYTCKLVAANGGPSKLTPATDGLHDTRIKAAVVAAPAVAYAFLPDGLRDVTIPVQLWRADADRVLPPPEYADAIDKALTPPPDFQTVPDAGHFDFLAPCSEALAARVPVICQERPGFDRAAFHRRLNATIVAFFNKNLQ